MSVLELADYSFFEIFKHLKQNCEGSAATLDEIKYDGLISFAASSERITDLLREWDANLYERLEMYVTFNPFVGGWMDIVDFEQVYTQLKNTSAKVKEFAVRSLSRAIRDTDSNKVVLRYTPQSFHSEHMETFRTVIDHLQNKVKLKALEIVLPGYSLEGLGTIKSLISLRLNVWMDIDDLVEICRLNKNLRELAYMNNETGGKRLAVIAPHCQQLRELEFKMRPDCDASEYRPLAKIPKLKHLKIAGVHEKGTLHPLLNELACKKRKVLRSLSIDDAPVDEKETQAIAQIETLTSVQCAFENPQSIGQLSQLPKLNQLVILSRHDFGSISEQVLSILKKSSEETNIQLFYSGISCTANYSDYGLLSTLPGLSSLDINGSSQTGKLKTFLNGLAFGKEPNLTHLSLESITAEETAIVSEITSLRTLECGFDETENTELLAKIPMLEELIILCVPSGGSLQPLLAALASRKSQTLKKFSLRGRMIDPLEAKELARLRSLQILKCRFADSMAIQLLSQLTELKELFLKAKEMFAKISPGIPPVVNSCKKHIIFDKSTGTLDFVRKGSKLDFPNAFDLHFIASLQNLRHVSIRGSFIWSNMQNFFYQLATWQGETLEKLRVDLSYEISSADLRELRKMNSLRTLSCRLSWVKDTEIEQLAQFPQLTTLIVGSHQTGSLKNLLENLAAKECPTLKYLSVKGDGLTPQEVAGVSAISSLKGLECAFYTTEGLNVLAKRSSIEDLVITARKCDTSLVDLLSAFANSGESKLHNLIIEGPTVNQDPFTAFDLVSQIPRLKSLTLPVIDTQGIEVLAEASHLEELRISSGPKRGSLEDLFRALSLKATPKLKKLVLEHTVIDDEEDWKLVQVDSIISLVCGFKDEERLFLLAKMTNLESLEITSEHLFPNISTQILEIFRQCRKLKTIHLGRTLCIVRHDFLISSLNILKSVRDPSTQGPLEMQISPIPYRSMRPPYQLEDEMVGIDEAYLIVTIVYENVQELVRERGRHPK
ncbi:GL19369 [Drosophila persimilis]|uniref:GL19369 n=1 Tax=Drosophila persimilis TaxID=7234 RepID=B4G8X3_DROPE|nr:GL19369 [Drosophila persimilis]